MKETRLGLGESFGVVSLAFATSDVRFPVRRRELARRIGDRKIQWTKKQVISLENVLGQSEVDEFRSFADVLSTVAHYEDDKNKKLTDFVKKP